MRRRDFINQTVLVTAAFSATPLNKYASGPAGIDRKGAVKKVIIIGAGLAGLSAAYELTRVGII